MSIDFNDFLGVLDDDPFEEVPVDFETFVYSDDYLAQPVLSDIQRDLVEAMSQIFRLEDLQRFLGEDEGYKHYKKYTKSEVILQLGKGSGKDHTSTIGCAYLVYKLLCLKDPARYFGKPPGDAIDIINIAINSEQAKTVFFKGFKNKIARSPWFSGKYDSKVNNIEFDKAITVYSGHSEREGHEGLNLILAILDEISGFAQESSSGNENAKTGDAIYKAFRASVDSRFPDFGKVVLLSFPRYPGDFISKRYDAVVSEKEVEHKTHTFVINDDLPHDSPDNNFTIEWEEDHILSYKYPGVFAIKRSTWDANPTRSIDDFKIAFMTDYGDAMQRFACVPSFVSDAFFKQKEKLEKVMCLHNPVDNFKRLEAAFKPQEGVKYFLHADLAQKHDKCAIAISHVDKWVQVRTFNDYTQTHPFVIVDAIVWWEPHKEGPVDLSEVKNWIVNFRRDGYEIGLVTFDRWQSFDIQQELKSVGIKTDTLSVAKKHYEDLAMLVYEERVLMPHIDILLEEMSQLRIVSDKKVDHPRKGCFTGDTLVPLLDGTDQTMESLEGSTVWVYSYDIESGFVVPARGTVKKTWDTYTLVRVVLDSGAVINCTPDHLFLLRSGVYKEAQHLRIGIDRIMPLNRHYPMNGGYEGISWKDSHKRPTHRVIAEYVYGDVLDTDNVVHHLNENKIDNRPENLSVMTKREHASIHGREVDDYKRSAMSEGTIKFNKLDSTRKIRSDSQKLITKEERVRRSKLRSGYRSDITIDKLIEVRADHEATNANMASKILDCGRNVVLRVLLEHGYSSWDDFAVPVGDNHRVRSVTHIVVNDAVPVYDLEVPTHHNFALTSGIFVHNSKDLSDAVTGAVYNAIAHSPRNTNQEISIHSYSSSNKERIEKEKSEGVIEPPKATPEVREFLSNMGLI